RPARVNVPDAGRVPAVATQDPVGDTHVDGGIELDVMQAGGQRHRQELVVVVDLGKERRVDQTAAQAQRGRIAALFGVDQANVRALGERIQDLRVVPRAVGDDDHV